MQVCVPHRVDLRTPHPFPAELDLTALARQAIHHRPLSIDHTVGMAPTAGGLVVGGDAERALVGIPVPSYVLDTEGLVRWINPAAERLLGDVRGRHFTSIVGSEDQARAKELFARKVLGTTAATETSGVFVSNDGTRVALEVSAVPLMGGERVVGVFGLLTGPHNEEASTPPAHLTPRQAEVLRLLEQGRSTKQIAQELHLSTETVKNHVRRLLRALGVNSRLEAVAVARHDRAFEVRAS
jgi:PAS domain S-box-containing protein